MMKRIKYILFSALLAFLVLPVFAQSEKTTSEEQMRLAHHSPEIISSVYHKYPGPQQTNYTAAPKGYEPVFISHYGRHGSRFLTSDDAYIKLLRWFGSQELTPLGKELYEHIFIAYEQAKGRGGELTDLGWQQHREIAERMYKSYPKLFKGDTRLAVYSSTSRRCMMSMMSFCQRLKELNPRLLIQPDVCTGNMSFIAGENPQLKVMLKADTEGRRAYLTFREKTLQSDKFLARMFVHPDSVKDVFTNMEGFYKLAQDMQDCGHPTELLSYLTSDEIYRQWLVKNCEMYLTCGDSPLSMGLPASCADTLVMQLVEDADKALPSPRSQRFSAEQKHPHSATLRFGHDTCLMRLLSRLKVVECCPSLTDLDQLATVWQDYNNTPMAANLQIIFYQNKLGNTLIRLMLNENEVHLPLPAQNGCYYEWEEVKRLWGFQL